MRVIPAETRHFSFDGRGPTLRRWIHDGDLLLAGSAEGFAEPPGHIRGAVYDIFVQGDSRTHFVVFHGLQVLQLVPQEVHAYWHRDLLEGKQGAGVFVVERSAWLGTFSPLHLGGHSHFVLELYDDIVEVICRELVFGEGDFEIEQVLQREPRLGSAYFRHACAQEKLGNLEAAIASWERYLLCAPHVDSVEYANRSLAALRGRLAG